MGVTGSLPKPVWSEARLPGNTISGKSNLQTTTDLTGILHFVSDLSGPGNFRKMQPQNSSRGLLSPGLWPLDFGQLVFGFLKTPTSLPHNQYTRLCGVPAVVAAAFGPHRDFAFGPSDPASAASATESAARRPPVAKPRAG